MASQKNQSKGILLVTTASLLFGTYGVWSKLIGGALGPLFQGYTRGIALSVILIPVLLFRKELIPIQKKDWGWLLVFLIFTSATQAPLFYAYTHMDIGSASLLFFVAMLLTMYLVGFIFLKEKVTKVKNISFILAMLGLATIFTFSLQKFSLLAALMAMVNGIASGGEVSFSKKLTGNYSALYMSLLSWLIIIPTNGLLSVVFGEHQILPSLDMFWFWQVCYIIASFFGFWFVMAGLKYVEASVGGLLGLLEVVGSVGFGILIFGEHVTSKIIIGAFLILTASALPHIVGLIKKEAA